MRRLLFMSLCALLCACSGQAQVKEFTIRVVKEYPHSRDAFTQGLFFHDGILYETTGQYGESTLRTVHLETGKSILEKRLNSKYFGEGSVILDGVLYVLTWTNKVAFCYRPEDLQYQKTLSWPREGWGLTTDGKQLIASDGTSTLYFLEPGTLKVLRRLQVTFNGRPLRMLNELEWIDGKIWANVYLTDSIVVIDPASGKVQELIDCKGLLPDSLRQRDTDVLNGIAVDAQGRIFITGKCWPRMYQIEKVPKKK